MPEVRKIKNKLKTLPDGKIFDIPWKISSECILRAKTSKAKQRLVACAIYATSEDYMRDNYIRDNNIRGHLTEQEFKPSFWSKVKSLFN